MKHYLPQIAWHDRQAIFTLSFQLSNTNEYKVVTAGVTTELRIWELKFDENNQMVVNFIADVRGHQEPVNVARFSPNGQYIASGENKGTIIIWEKIETEAPDIFGSAAVNDDFLPPNKEHWQKLRSLRCHCDDVSDLTWADDSTTLLSVSVDHSCVINNAITGQRLKMIKDHQQIANGIAIDPLSRYFATLSNDRSMRVYSFLAPKFKSIKKVTRTKLAVTEDMDTTHAGETLDVKLFHDDQLNSFVRRPAFSPDGELLIVPAGNLEIGKTSRNATFVFTRKQWDQTPIILPCPDSPTIAVAFNPLQFELHCDIESNITGLPYRQVFAVLSLHSVALYDTQQLVPFSFATQIHYAPLSDVAWSHDGSLLMLTSQDGYCSVFRFEPNELGVVLSERPLIPASPPPVKATPKSRPKTPSTGENRGSRAATPTTANVNADILSKTGTPNAATDSRVISEKTPKSKPAPPPKPKPPSPTTIVQCFQRVKKLKENEKSSTSATPRAGANLNGDTGAPDSKSQQTTDDDVIILSGDEDDVSRSETVSGISSLTESRASSLIADEPMEVDDSKTPVQSVPDAPKPPPPDQTERKPRRIAFTTVS